MKPVASFVDLIRHSSELMNESIRVNERARDTISRSSVVIDQSRDLLFSSLISRSPLLRPKPLQEPEPAARSTTMAEPEVRTASLAASPEQVSDRDFVDETLVLDGRHFKNCNVKNCVLEYHGGPVVLESTNFTGCRFRFGNEAAMTIAMLQCFGLMGEPDSETVLPPRTAPKRSSRVN